MGQSVTPKSREPGKCNESQWRSVYLKQKKMANGGKMVFKEKADKGRLSSVGKGLTCPCRSGQHAETPEITLAKTMNRQTGDIKMLKTFWGKKSSSPLRIEEKQIRPVRQGSEVLVCRTSCSEQRDRLWSPRYTVTFFLDSSSAAGMRNLTSLNTLLPGNSNSRKLPWKNKHSWGQRFHTQRCFASGL